MLKRCFDFLGVGAEFIRGEIVHFAVPIAVCADFVPLVVDGLDQLGVSLRYPTHDEEGGFGVVLGKEGEYFFGVAHYPVFHGVPCVGVDDVFKGGHLEVVFHIDGEVVADWIHENTLCDRVREVK